MFRDMLRSNAKVRFTSAARKAQALRKLGVSADQLANQPEITPSLRSHRGSLKPILEALRFSEDPVVECFVAKRDSLGVWARENTSWEAIGLAAGVDLLHLLGAALLALREHNIRAAKMMAMSRYPEVVQNQIEYAQLPGGWRERDAIDTLLGFQD